MENRSANNSQNLDNSQTLIYKKRDPDHSVLLPNTGNQNTKSEGKRMLATIVNDMSAGFRTNDPLSGAGYDRSPAGVAEEAKVQGSATGVNEKDHQ